MARKVGAARKSMVLKNPATSNPKTSGCFWNAFLQGMAGLWPSQPRDYIHPTGGGFAADAKAIRSDFGNIARDMRKALNKYEQTEANQRKIR